MITEGFFYNEWNIIDDVIQDEVTRIKYIEVMAVIMTRSWITLGF